MNNTSSIMPESDTAEDTTASSVPRTKADVDEDDNYPHGWALFAIMVSLFLSIFCVALDRTIIATAIPKITTQFNSLPDVGWYGSAYLLTSASFQLSFGKVYAEFNVKWTFIVSLAIFEIGSIMCAAAPNSPVLIVGRAIAGLGTAGATTGVLTILAASVPLEKRAKYTGGIGAALGVSQMLGPTIGGIFADRITWRWCFWINLPIGGATIPAILFLINLPKTNNSDHRPTLREFLNKLDFLGILCIVPSIICLLLALQWGGSQYAWKSWRIILLLCMFAVLFIAWGFVQVHEGDGATLPPRIVRQRSMAAAMAFIFFLMSMSFIISYYVPMWFQAVRNVSAESSGVDMLAMTIALTITAVAAGFATSAIGYYTPMMLLGTAISAVGSGLVYRFYLDTSTGYWIGTLIVVGIGLGMGSQPSLLVPQLLLKGPDIAIGTSAMVFMQTISGAIFLSVGGNLLESRIISELATRAPSVNPSVVIAAGASGLRASMSQVYDSVEVDAIITSYAIALRQIFLMGVIMSCLSIFGSVLVEWKSIKKAKRNKDEPMSERKADIVSSDEGNTKTTGTEKTA